MENRLLHGGHGVAFLCLWRAFGDAAVFLSLVNAPAMALLIGMLWALSLLFVF